MAILQSHLPPVPVFVYLISENPLFPVYLIGTSYVPTYVQHLSTYCCAPARRIWLHLICILWPGIHRQQSVLPKPLHFILRLNKRSLFSLCLYLSCCSPQLSCWPFAGLAPVGQCFSCLGEPKAGHNTPDSVPQVLNWGEGSLPSAHCCLANTAWHADFCLCCQSATLAHVHFVVHRTPWSPSSSAKLFSTQPSTSLECWIRLFHARCKTLHLVLLTFMRSMSAHLSSLVSAHWTPLSSSILIAPPPYPHQLGVLTNLLRVHFVPPSVLMKTLSSIGLKSDPRGMLLVTDCQLVCAPVPQPMQWVQHHLNSLKRQVITVNGCICPGEEGENSSWTWEDYKKASGWTTKWIILCRTDALKLKGWYCSETVGAELKNFFFVVLGRVWHFFTLALKETLLFISIGLGFFLLHLNTILKHQQEI